MASVRLHAVLARSRANGPGERRVIWFQGCTLGCAGCCNPQTHAHRAGQRVPVAALVEEIARDAGGIEGITLSGGEPFQQPRALLELVRGVRERTALSIVVFSGYERREIESRPRGAETLEHVDALVAGRYVEAAAVRRGCLASANQALHLLTPRYREADFAALPDAEVHIDPRGRVLLTGVASGGLRLVAGGE